MDGFGQLLKTLVFRAGQVADLVAFTAFHTACGVKEFAQSGFGIPGVVTTAASMSVLACAVAGNAHMTLEFLSKMYGKIDCPTCGGWEAMRCRSCRGTGKLQYLIVDPGMGRSEASSSSNVGQAVVDGRATLEHAPASFDVGFTLPTKQCGDCSGTGVMKCPECKGFAWQEGFHLEEVANLPRRAINAYKKLKVPNEFLLESLQDPATAEFLLITCPELQLGRPIDDDIKKEIWWEYEGWRKRRMTKQGVENEAPGWEEAQPVLVATDPIGTLENPSIIKNVSYYKARKAVESEIESMRPPPRPANWVPPLEYPLKESDWSEEELKDPKKREERDVLLNAQSAYVNKVIEAAWESHWREQKVEELTKKKIEDFLSKQAPIIEADEKPVPKPEPPPPPPSPSPAAEAPAAKVQAKKQAAKDEKSEKRKKERKERAEKMARQAAEREAALQQAKKGRK